MLIEGEVGIGVEVIKFWGVGLEDGSMEVEEEGEYVFAFLQGERRDVSSEVSLFEEGCGLRHWVGVCG